MSFRADKPEATGVREYRRGRRQAPRETRHRPKPSFPRTARPLHRAVPHSQPRIETPIALADAAGRSRVRTRGGAAPGVSRRARGRLREPSRKFTLWKHAVARSRVGPLDGEHTTDASSRRFVGLDGFAAVTSRERPRRVCRIPPANEHDRVYEPYGIGGSHRAQLRVGSDQLCGLGIHCQAQPKSAPVSAVEKCST